VLPDYFNLKLRIVYTIISVRELPFSNHAYTLMIKFKRYLILLNKFHVGYNSVSQIVNFIMTHVLAIHDSLHIVQHFYCVTMCVDLVYSGRAS
jgi:hypothetical protein